MYLYPMVIGLLGFHKISIETIGTTVGSRKGRSTFSAQRLHGRYGRYMKRGLNSSSFGEK